MLLMLSATPAIGRIALQAQNQLSTDRVGVQL